jgi:hypothetical protein
MGRRRLISWSRVLLEKPTVAQLIKKLHAFDATRRFITMAKRARVKYTLH